MFKSRRGEKRILSVNQNKASSGLLAAGLNISPPESVAKSKSLSRVRLFVTPWTTQSMEFSRSEYWCGSPLPSPGDHPNPGIKPRSPTLQADSLPAEPQGKPKNTGVGSLSLLQGIFPTQESNRGLLHCRRILYQLSYQGSPSVAKMKLYVNSDFFGRKRTLSFATKFSLL